MRKLFLTQCLTYNLKAVPRTLKIMLNNIKVTNEHNIKLKQQRQVKESLKVLVKDKLLYNLH